MFRTRPPLAMPQALFLVRATFKLTLGLFFLSFLLGYQPELGFPPIKPSAVYAQANVPSAQISDQTQNVASKAVPIVFQLPFAGYISTHFSAYHPGVDLATGFGMPIKPIAEGTVIDTEFNFFGYGMMVVVDHGHGYQSLYAHMNRIYVEKGQFVRGNDILGEVGLTGRTTGPHTHLEISKDGVKIDPLTILPPVREIPQPQDFINYDKSSSKSAQLVNQRAVVANSRGGSTSIPTLGNTKTQLDSPIVPEVKNHAPTQPLSIIDKLDIQKVLTNKVPSQLSFLDFRLFRTI